MPYYHIDNDLSKARGIHGNLDQFIIDHFDESIDNDEDWVIVVFLPIRWDWQTRNKIYQ